MSTTRTHVAELTEHLEVADLPWDRAGVLDSIGCEAFAIHGDRYTILVTDQDGPSIDTYGPYLVTLWDPACEQQLTDAPIVTQTSAEAITAAVVLFHRLVGVDVEAELDELYQTARYHRTTTASAAHPYPGLPDGYLLSLHAWCDDGEGLGVGVTDADGEPRYANTTDPGPDAARSIDTALAAWVAAL